MYVVDCSIKAFQILALANSLLISLSPNFYRREKPFPLIFPPFHCLYLTSICSYLWPLLTSTVKNQWRVLYHHKHLLKSLDSAGALWLGGGGGAETGQARSGYPNTAVNLIQQQSSIYISIFDKQMKITLSENITFKIFLGTWPPMLHMLVCFLTLRPGKLIYSLPLEEFQKKSIRACRWSFFII